MNSTLLSALGLFLACLNSVVPAAASILFSDWSKWTLFSAGVFVIQRKILPVELLLLLACLAPTAVAMPLVPLLLLLHLALGKQKLEKHDFLVLVTIAFSGCMGWASLSIADPSTKQLSQLFAVLSLMLGGSMFPKHKIIIISSLLLVPTVQWTLAPSLVLISAAVAAALAFVNNRSRVGFVVLFIALLSMVVLHSGAGWSLVAAPFLFFDGLNSKNKKILLMAGVFPLLVSVCLLKVEYLEIIFAILIAGLLFDFGTDEDMTKQDLVLGIVGTSGISLLLFHRSFGFADDEYIKAVVWLTVALAVYVSAQFWVGKTIQSRGVIIRRKFSSYNLSAPLLRAEKYFFKLLGRQKWNRF